MDATNSDPSSDQGASPRVTANDNTPQQKAIEVADTSDSREASDSQHCGYHVASDPSSQDSSTLAAEQHTKNATTMEKPAGGSQPDADANTTIDEEEKSEGRLTATQDDALFQHAASWRPPNVPRLLTLGGLATMPRKLQEAVHDLTKLGFMSGKPPPFSGKPMDRYPGLFCVAPVPALSEDIRNDILASDNTGGPDCIVGFQRLSYSDQEEIARVTECDPDISFFQPHEYEGGELPRTSPAENIMRLREFEALATVFNPDRLALRVFTMTHTMSRLLAAYRVLQAKVDDGDFDIVQRCTALQTKNERLERAWSYMAHFWGQEFEREQAQHLDAKLQYAEEMSMASKEHYEELTQLRDKIAKLEAELTAVESSSKTSANAMQFSNFLQTHVQVSGNWRRLHDLYQHFIDGTKPDFAGSTQVVIFTSDVSNSDIPDFPKGQDLKKQLAAKPKLKVSFSDFLKSGIAPSLIPQSQKGPKKPSSRLRDVENLQIVPSKYKPTTLRARSIADAYLNTETDAAATLPKGVVWDDQRADVKALVCHGISFKLAFKMVGEDHTLHTKFHRAGLLDMLESIMYHDALDETPWVQYVPRHYFTDARSQLVEHVEVEHLKPDAWEKIPPEYQEYPTSSASEADDAEQDPDYRGGGTPESQISGSTDSPTSRKSDSPSTSKSGSSKSGSRRSPQIQRERQLPADKSSAETPDISPPKPDGTGSLRASKSPKSKARTRKASPKQRKPKAGLRGHSSSQSSPAKMPKSGNQKRGATTELTSQSPSKKAKNSGKPAPEKSDSSSSSDTETQARRTPRVASGTRSALAVVPYEELDEDELETIETPASGQLSWCYYGIIVKKISRRSKSQSPGFPNYEPHRGATQHLKPRWTKSAYDDLVANAPWEEMFDDRVRVLYFHRYASLKPEIQQWLIDYVGLMEKHAYVFWEATHWLTLSTKGDVDAVLLYTARRDRRNDLITGHFELAKRASEIDDSPEALWDEPAVWTLPQYCCSWILREPKISDYSLEDQLHDLDKTEHARAQWSDCTGDEERMGHFDEVLLGNRVPNSELQTNLIPDA